MVSRMSASRGEQGASRVGAACRQAAHTWYRVLESRSTQE